MPLVSPSRRTPYRNATNSPYNVNFDMPCHPPARPNHTPHSYGGLASKAGDSFLAGCCAPFMGLGMLRTSVRRHFGIAPEGCPDLGCGSDCMTACCCTCCAALQLDLTLDDMAARGASMANSGLPKS